MFGNSLLRELYSIGFGADIDKLESYIYNFRSIEKIADMTDYRYRFNEMCELLHKVKPNSKALNNIKITPVEQDEYDLYFSELGNSLADKYYNTDSLGYVMNRLFDRSTTAHDLVAILNIDGIDINVIYNYGELVGIYGISTDDKVYNFSDVLDEVVPNDLHSLSNNEIVELRGKVTLGDTKNEYNVAVSAYDIIRKNCDKHRLHVLFHDIFYEEMSHSYWNKLRIMKKMGIDVVDHYLLRNVDKRLFKSALLQLDREVYNKISYRYSGYLIKENNEGNGYGYLMNYITDEVPSDKEFVSKVKSIIRVDNRCYLNIVTVSCNEHIKIDKIELNDIYDIEKFNIAIGSKIKFHVIENKAYLI